MAYKYEKATGDIVISGWSDGIAMSPHKGLGSMQNGNISTETEEIVANYRRIQESQTVSNTVGTVTAIDSSHVLLTVITVTAGVWITVSGSSITGLSNGNYYVLSNVGGFTIAQLSTSYNGSAVTGLGSTGTAVFTLIRNMGQPVAGTTEIFHDSSGNVQYRYYVLDINGLVWVYDTLLFANTFFINGVGTKWFLPDTSISYYGSSTPSGIAVLNGWLHVFAGNTIHCKPTAELATSYANFASGLMLSMLGSSNPHFAFVGHQGKLYYTDGNFVGSIFPNSSLQSGGANIQSYASFTTSTTTGTIFDLIGGSVPTFGGGSSDRIPIYFFASPGGSTATATTTGTMYWIQYALGAGTIGTFQVYAGQSGGSALDITTGASGTQYFTTYYPTSAGGEATMTFTPERLNLPFFEVSQSIAELGDLVIIGCKGNVLYPWNQIDPTPSDLIPLPENNAVNLLTVNNMVYVFAGQKGNIYVTNGSTASLVFSVPDYMAGIPGTPNSYIEPYFTWGGYMYLRGRVWFSIQDQTSTKTGNCGGVWSFVPTQNFFIGQDTGLSLRLENQSSYGNYNGLSTVLLPNQNQLANGPQYWNAWYSSISSPTYGIDNSDTVPGTPVVIESDFIPTGTMLEKKSFEQIEYKFATPLASGESIGIAYRKNLTDSYTALVLYETDSANALDLSGFFTASFEKTQWLQLKITLTPVASSSSSFMRLSEIRIR